MNKYYYDLHIHSCLSPCADNENTPGNIVGMGLLNGLQIMALTDHNTCKNCPPFYKFAKDNGIIPIAGMELTTAEDIHIIFLFGNLEGAMEFDNEIAKRRILIKNRADIFGEQLITDSEDKVVSGEENLLSNATTVVLEECPSLAKKYGGVCYPAHIDRQANGIIAVLGTFPKIKGFSSAEFHNIGNITDYRKKYDIADINTVVSSDAHYLWDISEQNNFFLLDDEPYSGDKVRDNLIKLLGGEK